MIDVERTTKMRKPIEKETNVEYEEEEEDNCLLCFYKEEKRENTIEVATDKRRTNRTPASIFTEQ
jgi:hypothetical protein